jgi:hypothetical protein
VVKGAHFRECVFRVCAKQSYTSQKQLAKLRMRHKHKDGGPRRPPHWDKWNEKVELEGRKNRALHLAAIKHAPPVQYGQTVQLQHVRSGKFVTSISNTVAEVHNECMRVALQEGGSEGSWFSFQPRFKVRMDGGQVYYGDQCMLQTVRQPMMLQGGVSTPFPDELTRRYEANLASMGQVTGAKKGKAAGGWRLCMYQANEHVDEDHLGKKLSENDGDGGGGGEPAVPAAHAHGSGLGGGDGEEAEGDGEEKKSGTNADGEDETFEVPTHFLYAGAAIRLFHPEAEGFIAASAVHEPNKDQALPGRRQYATKPPFIQRMPRGLDTASSEMTIGLDLSNGGGGQFRGSAGADAILSEQLSTKQLFFIESAEPHRGGCVRWGSAYRFRHVATQVRDTLTTL